MKTIVLMGISCLLLVGVYGVMDKQSAVSKVLSFNQANSAISSIGADNLEKTTPASDSTKNKATTSKTLDDSHWIDDPLFEKAAASELLSESETPEMVNPQPKAAPGTTIQASPKKGIEEPVAAPVPEVKRLILELNPDTLSHNKKIPTESI
jgi:hypothetical protein